MISCLTLFKRLRDLSGYLSHYQTNQRSARFEQLVCEAFAGLLRLPFYDADNEHTGQQYRVTWRGSESSSATAPAGPDGIARAHGFYLALEATRKTGTKQWSQEFPRCLDHARDLAKETDAAPADVYIVLVTTQTHLDTFNSVKAHNHHPTDGFRFVLMGLDELRTAVETSFLAFTMRHLDARKLLDDLLDCTSRAESLPGFRDRAAHYAAGWQGDVLELEKPSVLAVRSYAAMVKMRRQHVAVSEILTRLNRDPVIRWYFGRIEGQLDPQTIAGSLLQESLGAAVGKLLGGDQLFCPVPLVEFETRCRRRLAAVEDAQSS